jgi:hypothetical protein
VRQAAQTVSGSIPLIFIEKFIEKKRPRKNGIVA